MLYSEIPGEKTMRRFFEVKLAGRAAQLVHEERGRRILQRLALKQQNGTLGQPDSGVDKLMAEETMDVKIGDEIHHHHYAGLKTPITPPPMDSPSGAGTESGPAGEDPLWKKVAKTAAVVAGLGALPLAGYGAYSMLAPDPAPVVQPAEPVEVPGYGIRGKVTRPGEKDPFTGPPPS